MNRLKKSAVLAPVAVGAAVAISACGGGSAANKAESQTQQRDSLNLVRDQPIPTYTHSQIRQELIDIENAQANGVQSTTFFLNYGQNVPQGSCSSIGAPVASTTQLTNPLQAVADNNSSLNNGGGNVVIGQMDPNGVYTGQSAGTYVMCVDPSTGKTYAQYWEGDVRVVFGPAVWKNGGPVLVGAPSSAFSDIKSSG